MDHGRVDAVTSKHADGLAAARIISDRTHHGYIAAEHGRVTREICGCATESGAFRKQIPQDFAQGNKRKGKVFSFSHDYVMETLDSPVTTTVVDFEGGGRILCDTTDRDPEEIKVGMPVEMTFRRLYYVGGIYNYWWKCRPERFES